jgi:hypothetical protein
MPKKRKIKGKEVEAATSRTDDDFDDMLAELRAADLINPNATRRSAHASSSTNISSSSSSSSSSAPRSMASSIPTSTAPRTSTSSNARISSSATDGKFSEQTLIQACIRGDMVQLQIWAKGGICVSSGAPLSEAAFHGELEVMRDLVNDLRANVNQSDEEDFTF